MTKSELVASFGYHPSTLDTDKIRQKSNKLETLKKVIKVVAIVSISVLLPCAGSAIVTIFIITPPMLTGIFLGATAVSGAFLLGSFVSICISKVYEHRHICKTSGIIYGKQHDIKSINPKPGKCEALATEHSAETEQWRFKFIEAAQHNIIISGNYCGGKSFNKLLKKICERMEQAPELKVIIISSPRFLTELNLKNIAKIQEKFPNRFSLIESPDTWHISPGLKKTTNHAKCMVIDYGKYCMMGGSGIQDNFTNTGLDTLSKEDFLKQNNLEEKEEPLSDPLIKEEEPISNKTFISKCVPDNFRDMDFVFRCADENGDLGNDQYRQMLLLAYRWERYCDSLKNKKIVAPEFSNDQLAAFNPEKVSEILSNDSVITQLLKTSTPDLKTIDTKVPDFDAADKKGKEVELHIIASGPEQSKSVLEEKMINYFNAAKDRIVINHMFFHPTQKILNALIAAGNRGVKIEILTCGLFSDSPVSHSVFVPRNKYNIAKLYSSVDKDKRTNIEVFEFNQQRKGTHKKVIIVDDILIGGSSNLGYKSLVSTSDHELNFIAESKDLANQTLEIFEIDKAHSLKVENPGKVGIKNTLCAAVHRVLSPLIG